MIAEPRGPNLPEPRPLTLDPASTAVAVLDLTGKCDDPEQVCALIVPGVGRPCPSGRSAVRRHGQTLAENLTK